MPRSAAGPRPTLSVTRPYTTSGTGDGCGVTRVGVAVADGVDVTDTALAVSVLQLVSVAKFAAGVAQDWAAGAACTSAAAARSAQPMMVASTMTTTMTRQGRGWRATS